MIKIDNKPVDINHFPDNTLLLKISPPNSTHITWQFENNEELVALIYLAKHLRDLGYSNIHLSMYYIPNARQDRVKHDEDVFTLKYFAEIINSLNFSRVFVLDPHSSVSTALINNVRVMDPDFIISEAILRAKPQLLFYPDEGACKRYSSLGLSSTYAFGIKKRNWETGKIEGLDVVGDVDRIAGSDILIIDDICSRGGTFYHSAKKLKELGANKIYLYVTHCENTILDGELLDSGLIEKVYTTNSLFSKEHERIEVITVC